MQKNFLFIDDILKIIQANIKELLNIKDELNKNNNDIVIKGLFTYQISKIEIMMSDLLKMFLTTYIEKIPEKKFNLSKKQFLNNSENLIDSIAENYIITLSYDSISSYMEKFCEILSIDKFDDDIVQNIIEIKETRNLLIHNNLIINEVYIEKCDKNCCRATYKEMGEQLPLDRKYIESALGHCINMVNFIKNELEKKYKEYTKIKAMKDVWNYLFDSPILKFDDYFEYDNNIIKGFKMDCEDIKCYVEGGYSTTEMILMFFILQQVNDCITLEAYLGKYAYRFLHTNSYYGERKEKYIYLHNILMKYPFLFQIG